MYTIILITVCALVIFLGFEIRHNEIIEEVGKLKKNAFRMDEEIAALKSQIKLKKDAFEEHKPTMLYPPDQATA
ncbi:MAG: hypothetical protein WC569_02805 [Candidatus Omnitrophota bacterium]